MSEGPRIGAGKSPTRRTRSCPYPSINAAITYAVYFMPRSFVELYNIRPHWQQVPTAGTFRASKTRNHHMSRYSCTLQKINVIWKPVLSSWTRLLSQGELPQFLSSKDSQEIGPQTC